ncbi:glycosyltransferase family 2 protein [Oceanihabitans sediminis]|uniref:glycosyltransferase family 2 protein n=1 Tax=Oceanihabitans sediminis TaxID=1812012 RepID=UPI003A8EAF52
MLSILIPTYNYSIVKLVHEIHRQATLLNITFEILCFDDGSTEKELIETNKEINNLAHTRYHILEKNIGRSAIRNLLAKKAKHEHLLFLDADVLPKESNFLAKYIKEIKADYPVIYGGIRYQEEKPAKDYILRWKYGSSIESKSASDRNKSKYASILFSNTIIKKSLFLKTQFSNKLSTYGHEDTLLAYSFQNLNTKVLHIDSPVFHIGLDSNKEYLKKTKEALNNLKYIEANALVNAEFVKMLRFHKKLKSFKLNLVFGTIYTLFKRTMEKNLISPNSSLKIYNLYRLSYFCYINKSE